MPEPVAECDCEVCRRIMAMPDPRTEDNMTSQPEVAGPAAAKAAAADEAEVRQPEVREPGVKDQDGTEADDIEFDLSTTQGLIDHYRTVYGPPRQPIYP